MLDIVLETAGTLEEAVALAEKNSIALSDDLVAGRELLRTSEKEKGIVLRYEAEKIHPATALTADDLLLLQEGVGYWRVGVDFEVS